MRVAFKRPGFLFFRRFFFLKPVLGYAHIGGEQFFCLESVFGAKFLIPVKDTVIKIAGKGAKLLTSHFEENK